MNKNYDITVKIRITVDDSQDALGTAQYIAQHYADMALNYKSVGADKIVRVEVEEV